MKQCSVLIVMADGCVTPHRGALERTGFRVAETRDWPADSMILEFQVVIVLLRHVESACMVAARIRAKPHFGHRVLIAVAPATTSVNERRAAIGSGFDDVLSESQQSRLLITRILRHLRGRPEHSCFLPERRRRAA